MLAETYRKILYLPRPTSRRNPMAVSRRAKQFAPFAALKGFEEAVRKKEEIYEAKRILPEEKKNELDMKLKILAPGMAVQVEYFVEHPETPGFGQYHRITGKTGNSDLSGFIRIGDTRIKIEDICEISGDVFQILEQPC